MTLEFSLFRLFMKNVDKSTYSFRSSQFFWYHFSSKFSEGEKLVDPYKSDTLSFVLNFNKFLAIQLNCV
jgi:hypothetical protein